MMKNTSLALTDPVISIGTLARRVGLSVSAIRKYESEGLIIPSRTDSGRRLFSHEDIDRVRVIHHLIQNIGLNIEGIRRLLAMLPCWEYSGEDKGKRDHCPAFRNSTKPCWMIQGARNSSYGEKCRSCAVYRFGSQCTEDIKELIFGSSGSMNGNAIAELAKQRRGSLDNHV